MAPYIWSQKVPESNILCFDKLSGSHEAQQLGCFRPTSQPSIFGTDQTISEISSGKAKGVSIDFILSVYRTYTNSLF
jgi:hypothetical protein